MKHISDSKYKTTKQNNENNKCYDLICNTKKKYAHTSVKLEQMNNPEDKTLFFIK